MHLSETVRWILAIGLGLLGWWIILLNFAIIYIWFVRRKHHSWVPFLGGVLACVGMGLCPVKPVQRWAFTPLVIDVAFSILMLVVGSIMTLFFRKKKPV